MSISVGGIDGKSKCGSCHVCSELKHNQRQNLFAWVVMVCSSFHLDSFFPLFNSYLCDVSIIQKILDQVRFFTIHTTICLFYTFRLMDLYKSICKLSIWFFIYQTKSANVERPRSRCDTHGAKTMSYRWHFSATSNIKKYKYLYL